MKKSYTSLLYILGIFLLISACASSGTPTASRSDDSKSGGTAKSPKSEDLSIYRPKFNLPASRGASSNAPTNTTSASSITPTRHINDKVAVLLDTVASMNKSIRYAQGYRILAYSGTERKAAMDMRKAIIARMPEERDYLQYKQPTFRLKIGDYFTRVEAQQALLQIKNITPNAMIVADQINVK
ncbi:sporulation protein [Adhaeribacter aquaticus]|uniref:sporulation protein n=1 Tax=Adhaeribacter aquaticus TaxID=299567 RepID=UPI000479CCE4|nr:sporulation protein [Adhaeribacter aquaticus]